MKQGIQSVEIGVRVLDAIVRARRPLKLKEVAALSGMTASKARMYLISLIRTGLVAQDPATGSYAHGPHAVRLGLLAFRSNGLLNAAQDLVGALAAETGEPVFLSAWDEDRAMINFASGTSRSMPIQFRLGGTPGLTTTVTAKTFLAFKSEAEVAAALAAQELGPPSAALTEELARIRARGVAVAAGVWLQEGVTLGGYGAIAAPVFGIGGAVELVVTVLYRQGLEGEEIDALAERIRRRAAAISLDEARAPGGGRLDPPLARAAGEDQSAG